MERLWSPWRSHYISSFSTAATEGPPACFLCESVAGTMHQHLAPGVVPTTPEEVIVDDSALLEIADQQNLVVHRAEHCFVIMNRYPYNAGHLMVVPNAHIGDFALLQPEHASELMATLRLCHSVLTELYHPHGFNIGANLGRVAGAGVPDHIHFHIVPRWNGDTNFMPVLADVRVASESLDTTFLELRALFRSVVERA